MADATESRPQTGTWPRFWAAYGMELRLLTHHWTFPVLHLAWAALLWAVMGQANAVSARGLLADASGRLSLGLLSVVGIGVAATAATRGVRSGWAALAESYPTGPEVWLGRWLAAVTGVMTAAAAPLALAALRGPWPSWWALLPEYLAQALIAAAFATAATWLLIDVLGHRRWLYPALGAGWMVFGVLEAILARIGTAVPGLGLLDFMRLNETGYSDLWGYVRSGPLLLWLNGFYLALALALIFVGVARWQRHRGGRQPRWVWVTGALALLLAAGAAARYTATVADWNRRGEALRAATDLPASGAMPGPVERAFLTGITAYDLTVDLTDPAELRVAAALTLTNRGRTALTQATFALSPDLRVGAWVTLELPEPLPPGGAQTVSLAYAGQIWAVRPGITPYPVYFTVPGGVRLSAPAGWYPLTGDVNLDPHNWGTTHAPASFRIEVKGPAGWRFASNLPEVAPGLFAGEPAAWALLLGSPRLATATHGPVTLVAGRDDLTLLGDHAEEYAAALAAVRRFFPDVSVSGLTVLAMPYEPGLAYWLPSGGQIVEPINPAVLRRVGRDVNTGYYVEPVVESLWRLGSGGAELSYEQEKEVTRFLWRFWETGGDPAAMAPLLGGVQPGGDAAEISNGPPTIRMALLEVYRRHGEEGVVRILKQMRSETGTLREMEPAELVGWIQARAAEMSAP